MTSQHRRHIPRPPVISVPRQVTKRHRAVQSRREPRQAPRLSATWRSPPPPPSPILISRSPAAVKISFYISSSALDDELLHGAELRLYRHPTSSSSSTSSSLSSSSSSSSSLSSFSSEATSLYPTSFDNSVQERRRHRRSANVTSSSSSLPSSLLSSCRRRHCYCHVGMMIAMMT